MADAPHVEVDQNHETARHLLSSFTSLWYSPNSTRSSLVSHLETCQFRLPLSANYLSTKLEAASARMAARDRFGAFADLGLSPLQRAIRPSAWSIAFAAN